MPLTQHRKNTRFPALVLLHAYFLQRQPLIQYPLFVPALVEFFPAFVLLRNPYIQQPGVRKIVDAQNHLGLLGEDFIKHGLQISLLYFQTITWGVFIHSRITADKGIISCRSPNHGMTAASAKHLGCSEDSPSLQLEDGMSASLTGGLPLAL